MKKIFLLLFLFLLGCAPGTVKGVKENPAGIISFETDQTYEAAYRKASEFARTFETGFLGGANMVVHCDLYHDIKKGEISVALHNIFGDKTVYLVTEIEDRGQGKSFVTIFYSLSTWERHAIRMKVAILTKD